MGKLRPELVKLSMILFKVVGMIYYKQILLVIFTSLECPVERSCDQELVIHNNEFVMHVELGIVVSPHRDLLTS